MHVHDEIVFECIGNITLIYCVMLIYIYNYTFYIFICCIYSLFVLFRWAISDSTFTWVPSKARSSPDFLIIARTDARTTLGVKPVRWFSTWIYTDGTYDTAFLSDVVICDALFHHFSIFFQCFIVSYSLVDASLVANLTQFLLLGLEEALRRARAFAAAGADILFVEAPESEVATGGNPAANRRLHRRFVVGNLTSGRDGYDLQFFGRHW